MSQFTPRVAARVAIAKLLRDKHQSVAAQAGLLEADLDVIIEQGTLAAQADGEQKDQLAAASVMRTERKDAKDSLLLREDDLRNRLPAVIGDLHGSGDPGSVELAAWLDRLSFARYRFRALPADPAAPEEPAVPAPEEEEILRVKRVQREDLPSRTAALGALCRSLLKPGREPIIDAFAARGISRADIEALATDAEAIAQAGRNVLPAAEATVREAEAVNAQKTKWNQVRRMIRAAVVGIPELEQKLAEC